MCGGAVGIEDRRGDVEFLLPAHGRRFRSLAVAGKGYGCPSRTLALSAFGRGTARAPRASRNGNGVRRRSSSRGRCSKRGDLSRNTRERQLLSSRESWAGLNSDHALARSLPRGHPDARVYSTVGYMTLYDGIGRTYAQFRRPDPRIASAIEAALGDATSVVISALVPAHTNRSTVL